MSAARRVVVGTAGHIDHGKTALVRALTGVDTDRLPEEKARGITIDLGFAELPGGAETQVGVVDVPGHEDFVRAMVAGASGIDVALLVVAADEGVMPQTQEHVDILRLLAVPEMVVALTKSDLVDDEWRLLVEDDLGALLADTPYAGAPVIPTSIVDDRGLEALLAALRSAGHRSRPRAQDDLARLPVDRVFTLQGTGTVVTGTMWSGSVRRGERVRLLPGGPEARVRSVQVHGRDVDEANAGERTAVALAGVDRGAVERGSTLVTSDAWIPGWMITAEVRVLERSPWALEPGRRVRVHVGTAEVLARCAPLGGAPIGPGEGGWLQLRLEEPLLARARDRVILRSFSPVTTIGGGIVAEPAGPKRKRLGRDEAEALSALLHPDPETAVRAVLALAGLSGVPVVSLPVLAGCTPAEAEGALGAVQDSGGVIARGLAFGPRAVAEASGRILAALRRGHEDTPLRPAVPLDRLRSALPGWAPPPLAEGVLEQLRSEGALELAEGGARVPGYTATLAPGQAEACRALETLYREAGLAAPFLEELPEHLGSRPDLPELVRWLEGRGVLRTVDEGLLVDAAVLRRASAGVAEAFEGRTGLGPADFREVLPVSRRHLMPLLAYLDGEGVTVRRGPVRDVPRRP